MSTIRSVVPRSYEDVKREPEPTPDRERAPHACDYCGRVMEFADQRCACLARSNRIGWVR